MPDARAADSPYLREVFDMKSATAFDTRRMIAGLGAVAACLVAVNLAGLAAKFHFGHPAVDGWVPLFDLDGERNVPSVFSTGLILSCAVTMFVLARVGAGDNRIGWLGLSSIFVFLAADELVSLHERLIEPLRAALHTSGVFYFAWLIPYGVGAALLGLLYLRFLLRLPGVTRSRMIVAGTVYLAGAVGMELIGGAYLESLGGHHNFPYELLTTLEETLEMTGMILLLRALARHGSAHESPPRSADPYDAVDPVVRVAPKGQPIRRHWFPITATKPRG